MKRKIFPPLPSRPLLSLLALVILLVLGPLFYFRLIRPGRSSAAWYNDSWGYRKAVNITNSSGGALTDFQVSTGVGTSALISAGKMKSDCSDIRITDQNGKLLPHWIEEGGNGCNQLTDATVWTKVPSVPSSGGTVYVYYGNPSATAVADGNKVFEFFDNFNGTNPDSSKWNVQTPNLGVSTGAGIISLNNNATLVSKNTVSDSNGLGRLIFRAKQAATNLTGGLIGFSSTQSPSSTFASGESAYLGLGTMEEKLTDFGATNLMAQYKLDETTAPETNQFKASGYLDTGKLSQAVSIYGNSAGTNGSTLTFNSGSQISGNNYEHLNGNQGTVSFWFKPTWNGNASSEHELFGGNLNIYLDSNRVEIRAWDGTANRTASVTGITWSSSTWYHIVGKWDADNAVSGSQRLSITVNGTESSDGYTSNFSGSVGVNSRYFIGRYHDSETNFANSLIDDFAIYDRPLSTAEITSLYNSGTGNEAGYVADSSLKFYAKMDGTGTLSPVTYNAGASASKMTGKSTELTGGTNLLADGNMEVGSTASWPAWDAGGTPPTISKTTSGVFADTQSLKVLSNGDPSGNSVARQTVTISANTNYYFSTWYNGANSSNWAIIRLRDGADTNYCTSAGLGYFRDTSATTWKQFECSFKSGANTTLYVDLWDPLENGTYTLFDNVVLTPNLVDNGGMEGTYTGSDTVYVAPSWTSMVGAGDTAAAETTIVHSGSESQKIITSAANKGVYQGLSGITTGNSYLVSAWVYVSSGGGVKMVYNTDVHDIDWTVSYVTAGSWTKISKVFKQSTAFSNAILYFLSSGGASTFYIDDVSVLPLDNTSLSFQSWTPVDDSGLGQNDLSIHGSSTGVGSTTGVLNNAYKFDGSTGYLRQKTYDTNIGTLSFIGNDTTTAEFSDTGQNFSDYNSVGGTAGYMLIVTNSDNTTSWGYMGTANNSNQHMDIYTTKGLSARGWNGTAPVAGAKTPVGYEVRKTDFQITGSVTVGAWVKTTMSALSGGIIDKGANQTSYGYLLLRNGDIGRINFALPTKNVASNSDINDGLWHYVVGVYSSSTYLKIYIDGEESGSNTSGIPSTIADSLYPLNIGINVTSYNWNGSLDSPFVISSALTGDQIKALYNYYTVTSSHANSKTTPANTANGTNDTNYHVYSLTSAASSSWLVQDQSTLTTSTTNLPTSSQYLRIQNSDPTNNLTLDWVAVTKQASTFPTSSLSSTEEQAKSPVAYWSFDEGQGTVAQDESSNNNDGTLGTGTSAPSWQTEDMCISGKCLKFDGVNDIVNFGQKTSFDFGTNNFSIQGWFKAPPGSTTRPIMSKNPDGTYWWRIQLLSTGYLDFQIDDNVLKYTWTSSSRLDDNNWHYFALTRGAKFQIYIDGKDQLANGTVNSSSLTNSGNLNIGYDTYDKVAFIGFIDEVKIYPYARTAAEIKTDYNARGSLKGEALRTQGLPLQNSASGGLSQGLVGYWKMDEASWNGTANEVVDSSGNGNNGVAVGTTKPTTGAGKFGNGGILGVGSTEQYVSTNTNATVKGLSQYTISLWFKPNQVAAGTKDLYTEPASGGGSRIEFFQNGTSVGFGGRALDGDGWTAFGTNSNVTLAAGNWYHAVAVFDSINKIHHVYVNGVDSQLIVNSSAVSNTSPSHAPYIGADVYLTAGRYFNGSLDEVRIYNRALSPAEVRNLYNWAPGPVAYYNFNEGVGTSAYDTSGNGLNGVWSGTGTHWGTGKYGKAGKFNGTNDYVEVPNVNSLNIRTNDWTIESWIKTSYSGGYQRVVMKLNPSNDKGYMFRVNPTGYLDGYIRNGGSAYESAATNYPVNDGKWHHIVFYVDRDSSAGIKFFVDGKQASAPAVDLTPLNGADINDATINLDIGVYSGIHSDYFNGLIDEVKIYNYARTQKQIVEDMLGGGSVIASEAKQSRSGAIANYSFNEGYGTTTNNSGFGGNTLNGTLGAGSSAPTWSNDGKFGKALSFDGGGDYAYTANTAMMAGNGQTYPTLAISAWVYPQTSAASKTILNKNSEFKITTDSNSKANCSIYGNGSWQTSSISSSSLPLNTWSHVLCNYDGTNIRTWVNGVGGLNVGQTAQIVSLNTTPLNIAKDATALANYQGLIDEIKIYNYSLSQDEIYTDFNSGSSLILGSLSSGSSNPSAPSAGSQEYCIPGDPSICSPPVGRWDFNEGVGTSAYNTGTAGGAGLLVGNPVWKSGKIGKAIKFTANQSVKTNYTTTVHRITISAWINVASTQNVYPDIVGKSGELEFYVPTPFNPNGNLGFCRSWAVSRYPCWESPANSLTINKWHFVAVTYDDSNLNNDPIIYIDGNKQNLTFVNTRGTTTADSTSNSFTIGDIQSSPPAVYFNGLIDQVRIYNYARTPAQIAWDYNEGKPTRYFDFDECQGNFVKDFIGVGITAAVTIGTSGTQNTVGTCGVGSTASAWYNGASGKYNASLNLDGTDDFVNVGVGSSINSVSMWVKPTTNSTSLMQTGTGIGITVTSGVITAPGFTSPTIYLNGIPLTAQTTLTTGTWQMVTVTSATPVLGSAIKFGNFGSSYFSGQIDDIKVWNYPLTGVQVKTEFNQSSGIRFGE